MAKFTGKIKRISKSKRVSRVHISRAKRKLRMPEIADFLKK